MKLVYEAPNALEGHMILNLLEQAGLNARIDGEYLQGGVGELQAIGLVRVMVDDADYDAARAIIHDWDNRHADPQAGENTGKINTYAAGFIGFLLGIVVTVGLYSTSARNGGDTGRVTAGQTECAR